MLNRRQFLVATGSFTVASMGMLSGCGRVGNAMPNRLKKIGLQLSTITPLMLRDFEGSLAKVAEIGYREVEFSALGFLGRSNEDVERTLRAHGLSAPVGRVSPRLPEGTMHLPRAEAMKVFRARSAPEHLLENVRFSLDAALAMGQKYLNLPALMPDQFGSLDAVKRNIELLNRAGDICAAEGVLFGYHNHDWELRPIEGVIPYELMLAETPPDKVGYQLDSYWIVKGGGNLDDYLKRHAGRFQTCHLKDIDDAGDFADVGYGNIDFPAFVRQAFAQGARYFFVERDNPPEPEKSIVNSHSYLKQMTF